MSEANDPGSILSPRNTETPFDELSAAIYIFTKPYEKDGKVVEKGAQATVTKIDAKGWAFGELEDGSYLWYPIHYSEKLHDCPVAEVGTQTGKTALDIFVQQAEEKQRIKAKELREGKTDTIKRLDRGESFSPYLSQKTIKERPVEKSYTPDAALAEKLQAAQKKMLKEQKKSKKKSRIQIILAQLASGSDLVSPRGKKDVPIPSFKLNESQIDEIILGIFDLPLKKFKSKHPLFDGVRTGQQLIQYFVTSDSAPISNPEDAKNLGQLLLDRGVIQCVKEKTEFKSGGSYILTSEITEFSVINIDKVWGKASIVRDAYETSVSLLTSIFEIYDRFSSDFESLRTCKPLKRLGLQLAELQRATFSDLSKQQLMSTLVNLYNLFMFYIFAKFGPPASAADRKSMIEGCSIIVDKEELSLKDLEKRILEERDFLMHFTFTDCTVASPAAIIFRAESFEETKVYCVRHYLYKHLTIDESNYVIHVPKLMQKVLKYVGKQPSDTVEIVKPHLDERHQKILDKMVEVGNIDIKFSPANENTAFLFELHTPSDASSSSSPAASSS